MGLPLHLPGCCSVLTAYNMAVSKATKLMRQLLRQYRCAGPVKR